MIFDKVAIAIFCANILSIIFLSIFFFAGDSIFDPLIFVTIINLLAIITGVVAASINAEQKINSAIQIDRYYGLKDRILTAVRLCEKKELTPMMQIQIEDTANCISKIEPLKVVRNRLTFNIVLILILVSASYCYGMILMPDSELFVNSIERKSDNNPVNQPVNNLVNNQNNITQEIIDNIRNKNYSSNNGSNNGNDNGSNNLTDLSDELYSVKERLQNKIESGSQHLVNAVTAEDTMSALLEIEQAIKQAVTEIDVHAYNLSFRAMASAFDNAGILHATAAAIKNENYNKAASEIENLTNNDFNNMTQVEKKSVTAELHDSADKMRIRNQNELEQLTRKFANGLEFSQNNNKATADNIAQKYRQQAERNNLYADLKQQLDRVSQSKLRMIEMYNQELNQSDGGLFSASKNNSAGNYSNQDQESQNGNGNGNGDGIGSNWGDDPRGQSNEDDIKRAVQSDIFVTKIDIERNNSNNSEEKGRTRVEINPVSNADNTSSYEYKNLYLKYRNQIESVLEFESIPIGSRKMVRRYFDSIKPID
ncbi:MAG: hypothetical protein LBE18_10330 [Planctomycetaceae bacterium]|jgi:hypothetical protein|nr:hypothetical protein [Planctomycetaceae bacterium]